MDKVGVLTKLGWKAPADGIIQCFACMEKNHPSDACPNVKKKFQPKPKEFNKNSVCLYTADDNSQKICGIHLPNGCPRKMSQSKNEIIKKPHKPASDPSKLPKKVIVISMKRIVFICVYRQK